MTIEDDRTARPSHGPSRVVRLGPTVHERLRRRLAAAVAGVPVPCDGILLLGHANVVWASGFDHAPSERPVGLYLPVDGGPTLFVPRLELEHAEEVAGLAVEAYDEYPGLHHPVRWMNDRIAARRERPRRWAVDAVDARLYATVRADGHELVPHDAAVGVRAVKEPEELALIRAAARYADLCLFWILEHGGRVVAEGGAELALLRGGLEAARGAMEAELGDQFPTSQLQVAGTVHSGPRAALPHGRTGPRIAATGDVVIAGIGAEVGNYHAESGATFTIGEASDGQARLLAAADASREAAMRALRPGVACRTVNDAAMAVLNEAGLAPYVRHRIGHGMGVEGHEAPWLAPGDDTTVATGMVFSNEPGIYRPGVDGYRTIDTMIVAEDAVDVPSRFGASVPWQRRVLRTD